MEFSPLCTLLVDVLKNSIDITGFSPADVILPIFKSKDIHVAHCKSTNRFGIYLDPLEKATCSVVLLASEGVSNPGRPRSLPIGIFCSFSRISDDAHNKNHRDCVRKYICHDISKVSARIKRVNEAGSEKQSQENWHSKPLNHFPIFISNFLSFFNVGTHKRMFNGDIDKLLFV